VDPHQPAYWLSRDPADAALFLARTAVASRAVGGFVKAAEGGPSWLTPEVQKALGNAALGAGVGGLGGLGVGLFSKRKKNPLTSALTGAALGGVLGGAVPEVYNRGKAWLNAPSIPAGSELATEQAQAAAYAKLSAPWKLYYKLLGGAPPIPTGPKPADQLGALEQAKANTPTGELVGDTAAAIGAGGADLGKDYAMANPTAVGAHGLLGARQYLKYRNTRDAQVTENVRRGLEPMKSEPIPKPAAKRPPGVAIPVTKPETPIRTLKQVLGDAGNQVQPSWTGRIPGLGGPGLAHDAEIGRGLRAVMAGQVVPKSMADILGATPAGGGAAYRVHRPTVQSAEMAGRPVLPKGSSKLRRGALALGGALLQQGGLGIGLAGMRQLPTMDLESRP
jgi:hypothetical protein